MLTQFIQTKCIVNLYQNMTNKHNVIALEKIGDKCMHILHKIHINWLMENV